MILNGLKGKFTWKDLNSYGGMPSSHAALVITLAALIGYYEGWTSAAFAIAFAFAVVVIRDAARVKPIVRRHVGEHVAAAFAAPAAHQPALPQVVHHLLEELAGDGRVLADRARLHRRVAVGERQPHQRLDRVLALRGEVDHVLIPTSR